MDNNNISLEEIVFQFIDQYKFLFFPEQWNQTFMDYSKNEIFTLLLIYRKEQVNMTEIAEYLGVPLNTVTGIVARLEKRKVIIRDRDKEDKRIVIAAMSPWGKEQIKSQLKNFGIYFEKILNNLTTEEKTLLMKIAAEIFDSLRKGLNKDSDNRSIKKVKRITIE